MKARIANLGLTAAHPSLSIPGTLFDAWSIADFDALIIDPENFAAQLMARATNRGPSSAVFNAVPYGHFVYGAVTRRRAEVAALLHRKGGIVMCLLRPRDVEFTTRNERGASMAFDPYALLDGLRAADGKPLPLQQIEPGSGDTVNAVRHAAKFHSSTYLRALAGLLKFEAHLREPILDRERTVVAVDSVGDPIALEYSVGQGLVCFLPLALNAAAERLGAAIFGIVESFFSGSTETDYPDWVNTVEIPGASRHDTEIEDLENRSSELTERAGVLRQARQGLLDYKKLLYGSGRASLEPIVREAFRLLGFSVPAPESYTQAWDVLLTLPDSQSAICEVEGSHNAVDVAKLRQLSDYIDTEAQEGRDYKGILLGNGFRNEPPHSPKRECPFSEHVLNGAARRKFCLIPSLELFKAICAVLGDSSNDGLKNIIRDSILSTTGLWSCPAPDKQEALKPTES